VGPFTLPVLISLLGAPGGGGPDGDLAVQVAELGRNGISALALGIGIRPQQRRNDVPGSSAGPRVHIKAPQERVWAAITTPEWAVQYGYQSPVELDLRPGGAYRALPTAAMVEFGAPADQPILDGEILEVDPPNRLVQSFRTLWDEEARAEGFTRLTYELVTLRNGITRLSMHSPE
jgi:uncharacterized protein YndB with AHSA1/START domain